MTVYISVKQIEPEIPTPSFPSLWITNDSRMCIVYFHRAKRFTVLIRGASNYSAGDFVTYAGFNIHKDFKPFVGSLTLSNERNPNEEK